NDSLVRRRASETNLLDALTLVHVARFATDVRLVNFDVSGHHFEGSRSHSESDAVKHEPRRLLSDAESASEFVRTDPVLRVGRKPDSGEPLVQAERRVLKDRPEFDAELFLARLAFPDAARGQV